MDFISLIGLIITLVIDTSASWLRMFAALAVSVVVSIGVGIYAATHRKAEKIILPIVDILQTLPILAFFPFVIVIIVTPFLNSPYQSLGINIAVIFLIITSMVWNIIFGVYESIKTIPKEYFELSELYGLTRFGRLRKILIPACMPRVVEQSILSWSIGLFYLVTSEIFSAASNQYVVTYGIGTAIAQYSAPGNGLAYVLALIIFILFVVATRLLFFKPWEERVTRYNKHVEQKTPEIKRPSYVQEMGALGTMLMKRLGSERLVKIGSRLAKIRKSGRQSKGYVNISENPDKFYSFVKYGILAIIIAVVICVVAINPILITDEGMVLQALALSFGRVWLAFAISLSIGIPICVYLIFITQHNSKYLMFFQILASIPATILLPAIANALRGTPAYGEVVALIVFVLSSIWYIIFSTMNVAKTLQPNILEVRNIFGVKGWEAWKKIYFKAIIPGLITGGITAIAAEWNASIVAESFTVGGATISQVGVGLGKLLDTSLASGNYILMGVALVNLTVMIILLNTFVWKRLYRRVSKTYS
jgi:NitT/TauT family transport system permease protein